MGDIFSLGFGPFRWICASGLESDLQETDKIAQDVIKKLMSNENSKFLDRILFLFIYLINSSE